MNWLQEKIAKLFRTKSAIRTHAKCAKHLTRLGVESLEDRQLMSASTLQIANAITHSAEYYSGITQKAYHDYLGRGPDAGGQAAWVGKLQEGLTDEKLEAKFLGSPEYIASHGGTGSNWVQGMYQDLLGRPAEPEGLDYWVNRLNGGADPASVAFGFAASAEREGQHVAFNYQHFLGRSPEADGLHYWVDQFVNHGQTNENLAASFLGSDEFLDHYAYSDVLWVRQTYQRLLDRAPNSTETTNWLQVLTQSQRPQSAYTPDEIRHAYQFDRIVFGNSKADGSGQTIAIVAAYNEPNIVADLHAFDLEFGLPDPVLQIVNQTGGAILPQVDPSGKWGNEIALDVEWSHAIAPGARILLVLATDNSSQSLYTSVDFARHQPGVSVVSMSFGSPSTSNFSPYDSIFSTPEGHNGVTFVAASGDEGVPLYPSTSPNVLSIGGTTLRMNGNGAIASEVAWSGSGGSMTGHSALVAYNADPATGFALYNSFNAANPWKTIGGTSAGAPQWAALIAVANEGRALHGDRLLGEGNSISSIISALPQSDFHDIVSGSNKIASSSAGFDLVTGRGSPIVNRLIADLALWAPESSAVLSFARDNFGNEYQLFQNGNLWQYYVDHWSMIDSNVACFTIGSDGQYLYWLKTDGDLYQEGYGVTSQIASNVSIFKVGSDAKYVFWLQNDGALWQEGYGSSSKIASNVTTFSLAADATYVFWRQSDGTNWKEGYGVTTLESIDGISITWSASRQYAFWLSSGSLYTWAQGSSVQQMATGVAGFILGSDNQYVFWLKNDGTLWQEGNGNTTQISNNVAMFTVGSDAKYVFWLQNDGALWQEGYGSSSKIASNVTSFSLAADATFVFWRQSDGTNWKEGYGVTTLESVDGTSIAWSVSRQYAFWLSSGSLYTWAQGSSVQQMATGVASFILGSDNQYVFWLKSDGTLWQEGYGSTSMITNGVVSFYLSADAQYIYFRRTDGTLWREGYGVFSRIS